MSTIFNLFGVHLRPDMLPSGKDFPTKTGREIYQLISRTGLNRSSVMDLLSFVNAGLVVSGDPEWSVGETAERLIVDGSFAHIKKGAFEGKEWIENIIVKAHVPLITETQILQEVRTEDGSLIPEQWRIYRAILGDPNHNADGSPNILGWEVVIQVLDKEAPGGYRDEGNAVRIVDANEKLIPDAITSFPNGLGLLYWAQKIFWRMEQIEETVQALTKKSALARIVGGMVGDIDQAKKQFEAGETTIFVPGNVTVQSAGNISALSELFREMELLLKFWQKAMKDTVSVDDPAESGTARRLKMMPMLQFVKVTRQKLEAIFEPQKVTFDFDKVEVTTIVERTAEYDLFKKMRDDQVLTQEEFSQKAKTLI